MQKHPRPYPAGAFTKCAQHKAAAKRPRHARRGAVLHRKQYRLQRRGGKGILNYHVEKYGDVAAIKVVDLDDDIILISDDGIIIRIEAQSVRICARPSKGVRVMKLAEGSRVITMARAPHDEDEEISAVEDDGTAEEGMAEDPAAEDETEETSEE